MRFPLLCLAALASTTLYSFAQTPAATPAPAATVRPAPIVSPEVAEDRQVTFRLRAPLAQQVELDGQWSKAKLPLTKDENGVWTVTTGPVEPGVWEYSFTVDGLKMIDPANRAIKPQRNPNTSILQVTGATPNLWDFQDVPHGTVHQHTYKSQVTHGPREVWVYTPPGYERDTASQYPLLVLQHGSGDNQQTWVAHGKAHWILDNLIASGKARPMVVMMIDGHPLGLVPRESAPERKALAIEAFRKELLEEAMPIVDATYRVKKDPADRAIAGLSMGGGQSLSIGLSNLDRFGWIGAFSAAPPEENVVAGAFADAAGTNQKLKLLWIACGKDDFLQQLNSNLIAKLDEAGIRHEWHLTEGAHSWPVWRNYLIEFAPRLFQNAK